MISLQLIHHVSTTTTVFWTCSFILVPELCFNMMIVWWQFLFYLLKKQQIGILEYGLWKETLLTIGFWITRIKQFRDVRLIFIINQDMFVILSGWLGVLIYWILIVLDIGQIWRCPRTIWNWIRNLSNLGVTYMVIISHSVWMYM